MPSSRPSAAPRTTTTLLRIGDADYLLDENAVTKINPRAGSDLHLLATVVDWDSTSMFGPQHLTAIKAKYEREDDVWTEDFLDRMCATSAFNLEKEDQV